ncbi:glycosyltransferase [Alkalicoccus luteus]|uniref:Glycosyltransferase family 4 protein n=1 Tax=Alkalicoccus luteus TaxID=1237094 RepID=A0A969PPX7_9BACI|nr:glycosyltransferase family 4 protein [Alkalicoccus luteus]
MQTQLVIAAPHLDVQRGNKITADRIETAAAAAGFQVTAMDTTGKLNADILGAADIVHGFHAFKFYPVLQHMTEGASFIITITGTDINYDLNNSDRHPAVVEVLKKASLIHVFDEYMKQKIPVEFQAKTEVLPQSVPHVKVASAPEPPPFKLLIPAGIRRIKQIPEAVAACAKAREVISELTLTVVGPVLEEAEKTRLDELEAECSWLTIMPSVNQSSMQTLYESHHAVINHSSSEGQSSALLEAMAAARPALVSDIDGNKGVIQHGINGFVFNDQSSFVTALISLQDKKIYQALSDAALETARTRHNPAAEQRMITSWYRKFA